MHIEQLAEWPKIIFVKMLNDAKLLFKVTIAITRGRTLSIDKS